MKKITVANQKGGVGKTTVEIHTALFAAEQDKKVLIIDLDEGDLSLFFGEVAEGDTTPYLMSSELFSEAHVGKFPRQVAPNVWLIEADVPLLDVDDLDFDVVHNLKVALKRFENDFDLCLIDTPPNLQRRMIAALVASDHVVSPFNISKLTFSRMPKLMATIDYIRSELNPSLNFLGFLPNMVNSRSPDEINLLPSLRDAYGDDMFDVHIIYRPCVNKALANGDPVWFKPNGSSQRTAGREMKQACDAILSKAWNA